jgi:XRE family transcriptional regulator, master regulator for biofilm formation
MHDDIVMYDTLRVKNVMHITQKTSRIAAMDMIGKRLRELRLERGLSIRELAKEVGISHNTLAAYERHAMMPSLENGYLIAEYFEIPIEYFLKGKKVFTDFNDSSLLALFREVDEMDAEYRGLAKRYLTKLINNHHARNALEREAE